MKTTLDLPDDLYRQAKARAAREQRPVKELVAAGLRSAMKAETGSEDRTREVGDVLRALDEVLRSPPLPAGRIEQLQAEVRRLRADGWAVGEEGK